MQHPLPFTSLWVSFFWSTWYSLKIPSPDFLCLMTNWSISLQVKNLSICKLLGDLRYGIWITHPEYMLLLQDCKYSCGVQFGTNQLHPTENDIQLSWELEISHRTSRGQSNSFHCSRELCITLQVEGIMFSSTWSKFKGSRSFLGQAYLLSQEQREKFWVTEFLLIRSM